jgi:microcystin-dependent protein
MILALGIGGGIMGSSFMAGAASSTGTCLPVSKGGTGVCTLSEAQTALGIKNPLDSYPVGAIYTSTTNTNPNTFLGGTWTQFGQGRTLLGVGSNEANTNTTTFGNTAAGAINRTTVEERGGAVTHTLATTEMPSHTHTQTGHTHTFTGTALGNHNHTQNSHTHPMQGGFVSPTSNISGWTPANVAVGASFGFSYNLTAGTNAATATNIAASAGTPAGTNSSTTATNQNTGGGGAHNNIQPYITVYFWKRTN